MVLFNSTVVKLVLGSFRRAAGLRMAFEREMGGDRRMMPVRSDQHEAVTDAIRGDDDIAERHGHALLLEREAGPARAEVRRSSSSSFLAPIRSPARTMPLMSNLLTNRPHLHSRALRTSDSTSYLPASFAFLDILLKPRRFPGQNSSIDLDLAQSIALYSRPMPQAPIILHIPHSRPDIPADVRSDILLDDADLRRELLRMTDWYTDELFDTGIGTAVVYPVSRLVADPERFIDDKEESMSKKGMGVVYTRTSDGAILRQIDSAVRADLVRRFYRPHHERLERAVTDILENHIQCLIIDCHSFSSTPLPHEHDQTTPRPDICLGTDSFHTPESLVQAVETACRAEGLVSKRDSPFRGTLVPSVLYHKDERVRSIMIELDRSLYMDEATGLKAARFKNVHLQLGKILKALDL